MTSRKLGIAAVVVSVLVAGLFRSLPVSARDDRLKFPIAAALELADAKAKLDPKVALYFAKKGPGGQDLGTFTAAKKTRAMGRSDEAACEWVFLSALLGLQERARQLQATAVVNIESVYKDEPFSSDKEFMCGVGTLMAAVSLRGTFIKTGAK